MLHVKGSYLITVQYGLVQSRVKQPGQRALSLWYNLWQIEPVSGSQVFLCIIRGECVPTACGGFQTLNEGGVLWRHSTYSIELLLMCHVVPCENASKAIFKFSSLLNEFGWQFVFLLPGGAHELAFIQDTSASSLLSTGLSSLGLVSNSGSGPMDWCFHLWSSLEQLPLMLQLRAARPFFQSLRFGVPVYNASGDLHIHVAFFPSSLMSLKVPGSSVYSDLPSSGLALAEFLC